MHLSIYNWEEGRMRKIEVKVGSVTIGGGSPIVIQSMCNTSTASVDQSFAQSYALAKSGAQLIRLTTPTLKDLLYFAQIKKRLRESGVDTPLVADVHFSYKIAIEAAMVADKVRINPGNFAKDRAVAKREFINLMKVCKERGVAIRIGVNHGSLGEYYTTKYGNTPYGMAMVAWEWLEMAKEQNFTQIVLSLKSSNIIVMLEAYRLFYSKMSKGGTIYPLHLGVTEAGNDLEGRVKSTLAIAALLREQIGDTIRVSLTENPLNEISVAKEIIQYTSVQKSSSTNSSLQKDSPTPLPNIYRCSSFEQFVVRATADYGEALLNKEIDSINIKGFVNEKEIAKEQLQLFEDVLMQAARRRVTTAEYIACPGCGRTLYDIETVLREVKERTAHLKGYKIAVMGCIVNGPGEMADAHYGYVGAGKGKVTIYRGKEPIIKSIEQERAIDALLELIEEDSRNGLFPPQS